MSTRFVARPASPQEGSNFVVEDRQYATIALRFATLRSETPEERAHQLNLIDELRPHLPTTSVVALLDFVRLWEPTTRTETS